MRAETFALAVCTDVHVDTGALQLGRGARNFDDIEILLGRGETPHTARLQHRTRHVTRQQRMLPHIAARVPIMFAIEPAVADHQRRRVADLRLRPELFHVVVNTLDRQRVLDPGVAIDHHVHIVLKQRAAFGHHHHIGLARGFNDLLALIATRLVIAFHRRRTGRFHALQMRQGIIETIDHGARVGLCAVENGAGRVNARGDDFSRALHFAVRKNGRRVVGRIVNRRDTKGQRRVIDPALLRDDLIFAHAAVPMHVDNAGNNCFAARIDHGGTCRSQYVGCLANGCDAIVFYHNAAIVDHLVAFHGDDACAGNNGHSARLVRGFTKADFHAELRRFRQFLRRAVHKRESVF